MPPHRKFSPNCQGQFVKVISAQALSITISSLRKPGEPSAALLADLSDPGQNFQSDDGVFRLTNLIVGMPLQVTVSARGYERTVVERVVVAGPDEAKADEYKLVPLDPATLRTYRGRLLDPHGKPVAGVRLRLIAATDRTPVNSLGYPFNWPMIESGEIAEEPKVTRFLEAVTDAQGRFEFTEIPRRDQVELVWWGTEIAPGRRAGLEKATADAPIEINTPEPARIVGTIDRAVFGDTISVQLSHSGMSLPNATVDLKPGETTFEFKNLAPSQYHLSVVGPPGQVDSNGGFTRNTLATKAVSLNPGEVRPIRLGK